MTSRPSLATHRPQQNPTSAFPSRASSRASTHPQSLPVNAVERPDVIDLTFEPTKAAIEEASPLGPDTSRADDSFVAQDNDSKSGGAWETSDGTANGGPQLDSRGKLDVQIDEGTAQQAEGPLLPWTVPTDRDLSPPPLPSRPGSHVPHRIQQPHREAATQSSGMGKDAPLKPYILVPPSFAPRFPKERTVDFFPWSGNHPEDVLSDNIAKTGYCDNPQLSFNETNTASTALRQTFKHKSGLSTLSSLLVSIYEQRQAHGRVTATSTFKPPPRVTLTDTKREAWLRDLASSSVPLRRLSRTIPHGIRGKVLLEQCLGKNIPTARAVWLAKCVGANEMRAFKRKGASGAFALGGEVKWVRDWTLFVEQFLEGVISMCGEKDWKSKMNYATRLSSHLYAEHLLDKDHYFDWVQTSLVGSSLDKLPIWVLVLQIFWEDLVQSRKNGRRMAESLLEKLHMATTCDEKDLFLPIIQRLSHLVTRLMVSRPSNFILPKHWFKYQPILHSCIDHDNHIMSDLYAKVTKRNLRFTKANARPDADSATCSRSRLIKLLDSTQECFRVEEVSSLCLDNGQDQRMLILALLEWMSSSYREGIFRVFLAVRVFRDLGKAGTDINSHILDFLTRSKHAKGFCKAHVYQLVSELVPSGHFSTSRYLQWLIARGVLSGYQALSPDDPCDVRLLAELPLQDLQSHIINLRRMLLREAGFDTEHESRSIAHVKGAIAQRLPGIFPTLERGAVSNNTLTELSLPNFSRTVKSEICRWIRQQVRDYVRTGSSPIPKSTEERPSEAGSRSVTLAEFNTLRYVLEECQDFSMLADFLRLTLSSSNSSILASVADTLNGNHRSFAAMGSVNDLFHILVERERAVSQQTSPEGFLLTSMLDLGTQLPGQGEILRHLRQDLNRCEQQKTTIAAWSPISDHMPDSLPHADIKEEVERVLASGTNMEKHTLAKLLEALLLKLESVSKHSEEETANLANLLSRLRKFHQNGFEGLVAASLDRLMSDTSRTCLFDVVPSLVSSGALTLTALFQCSSQSWGNTVKEGATPDKVRATVRFLELVTKHARTNSSIYNQSTYRWRLEQRRFVKDNALKILASIVEVVKTNAQSKDAAIESSIDTLLGSSPFISMLRALIVQHPAEVRGCFMSISANSGWQASMKFEFILNQLLQGNDEDGSLPDMPPAREGVSTVNPEVQIVRLMQQLEYLSLPFCQIRLQLLFQESNSEGVNSKSAHSSVINSLCRSIDSAVAEGNFTWVETISVLNSSVASQIRERAEERILSSIPTSKMALTADIDNEELNQAASLRSFSVLAATAYSIPEHGAAQLGARLIEKIECLVLLVSSQGAIGNQQMVDSNPGDSGNSKQHLGMIHFWIDILLRILIIHKATFQQGRVGALEQARLLIALCSILISDYFQDDSDLTDAALDVASCLVDDLSDEARGQCMKYMKDRSYDPRLQYLFGYQEGSSDWLKLSQRGKLCPYPLRHWEILPEPTPVVGDNDTSRDYLSFSASLEPDYHCDENTLRYSQRRGIKAAASGTTSSLLLPGAVGVRQSGGWSKVPQPQQVHTVPCPQSPSRLGGRKADCELSSLLTGTTLIALIMRLTSYVALL